MADKKIDTLFKDSLKSLEVSPNKRVWNAIETKLKKKKRRVFPFWLISGSVAAILVLGLFLYPFLTDENQNLKHNSDEIITINPSKKPINKNTIDTLTVNSKKTKEVLITKKTVPFINQKKNNNILLSESKREVIQSKKIVKKLILKDVKSHNNFKIFQETPTLKIANLNSKTVSKKVNLNTFLKKEENIKNNKKSTKNWSVAPVFGVLQSNSFSNTSPVSADLATSTNGENSFSYGFQVGFKINKRWTIQSGIHLQEMRYSNNQIVVYPSEIATTSSVAFMDDNAVSFSNNSSNALSIRASSFSTFANSNRGNLLQNFGYIEIPVEIKYNFSNNKKIDAQLVTGFSSLFLDKNEVILNTLNSTTTGELTNLNNINFSGNLGLDFNYFLNNNWSLNVNPMFKVQLNTFSSGANGFAPFNLGIYSGVKYQF